MNRSPLCRSFALLAALAAPIPAQTGAAAAPRPVDLCLCLDTSGSMSGLLNAARQSLWAVVNEFAAMRPTPQLRIALLTYGSPEYAADSGWVRIESGFTADLDLVSQKLFELTTSGGVEYVARVVRIGLDRLDWSPDPLALRLMFVAGNEPASQDPLYPVNDTFADAIRRGVVVDAIYCGGANEAAAASWRQAAAHADGHFVAIDQNANAVIATPFDDQLAALSAAMSTTYVPYGNNGVLAFQNMTRQDANSGLVNNAAAAQRCQTKAGELYFNGAWDLVDAGSAPTFDLEAVDRTRLPPALQDLSTAELRQRLDELRAERGRLRHQAQQLGAERDAYLAGEQRRAGEADRFGDALLLSVRAHAAARSAPPALAPTPLVGPPTPDRDERFTGVVLGAAGGYRQFARVTGEPHVAPKDCWLPPSSARRSTARGPHGDKLYLLYARFADGLEYVTPGVPAATGQTLVKEAWTAEPGEPSKPTESQRQYGSPLIVRDGDGIWHAGTSAGVFVMHKLPPGTEGTDQGWVYGTIDRDGEVTSAGRVASCIRCHERAVEDRRFGLR